MTIDFYFDVVCPYAYMASTVIDALGAEAGVEVRWRPILLGGVLRSVGAPDVPAQTYPESKQVLGQKDILRQAERFGLDLTMPDAHPRRTVDAMRLLTAARPDQVRPLAQALYQAYFLEDRDVADHGVLAQIAEQHGVDFAVITSQEVREGLRENTQAAVEAGVFGVPTIVVDGKLEWGADRLQFVRQHLSLPRARAPSLGLPAFDTVDFFHDFSSPFSYLAATQAQQLADEVGAQLRWRPILLGALFRSIGTPDVPMMAMNPARQRYVMQDLASWASWWQVAFTFPTQFPIRTVTPLRVAIQEPRTTALLYEAAWVHDQNIGQDDVLVDVLNQGGFDGQALLEGCQNPEVKQALRDNTNDAIAGGVCGVPSFVLPDGMVIWGQDRLDHLRLALTGWRPKGDR